MHHIPAGACDRPTEGAGYVEVSPYEGTDGFATIKIWNNGDGIRNHLTLSKGNRLKLVKALLDPINHDLTPMFMVEGHPKAVSADELASLIKSRTAVWRVKNFQDTVYDNIHDTRWEVEVRSEGELKVDIAYEEGERDISFSLSKDTAIELATILLREALK